MAVRFAPKARPDPPGTSKVGSVRTFLDALVKFDRPGEAAFFYRGHPSFMFALVPSVYRNTGWIANEDVMIKELTLRCPGDFPPSASTFQTLVKMQHYSLPTRLLDLTANPLIALYFATDPAPIAGESGEVVAFKVPKPEIKYYDSDTVGVMSNIARRPSAFSVPSKGLSKAKFNETDQIRYLLHEIRQEKPHFEPVIVRAHLESVVCVKPKMENPRIVRQDGAFFLFGVNQTKTMPAEIPQRYIETKSSNRIIIDSAAKPKIRGQLEALGISAGTVYPEIDKVAEFIRRAYEQRSEA